MTKIKKKEMKCVRCGIEKRKGFYEAGCKVWGKYFKKHMWSFPTDKECRCPCVACEKGNHCFKGIIDNIDICSPKPLEKCVICEEAPEGYEHHHCPDLDCPMDCSDKPKEKIEMYCVRCRTKKKVKTYTKIDFASGKFGYKSNCPDCGLGMYKIFPYGLPLPSTKEWEKEFGILCEFNSRWVDTKTFERIKQFIKELLAQQQKEIREEIEKMYIHKRFAADDNTTLQLMKIWYGFAIADVLRILAKLKT